MTLFMIILCIICMTAAYISKDNYAIIGFYVALWGWCLAFYYEQKIKGK